MPPTTGVSGGLQPKSPRPGRQRTVSMSQNTTISTSESIIRSNNKTIYTAGRPPWYDSAGESKIEPFVIGNFLQRNHLLRK